MISTPNHENRTFKSLPKYHEGASNAILTHDGTRQFISSILFRKTTKYARILLPVSHEAKLKTVLVIVSFPMIAMLPSPASMHGAECDQHETRRRWQQEQKTRDLGIMCRHRSRHPEDVRSAGME